MICNAVSAASLLVFDRIFVGSHEERVLRVTPVGDEVKIITDKGCFVVPADASVTIARALSAERYARWDKSPAPATVATNALVRARGVASLYVPVFADDDPRYAALQGLIEEQLADDRCNVRRREGRRPRDGGAAGAARWWSEAGEDALANVGILG